MYSLVLLQILQAGILLVIVHPLLQIEILKNFVLLCQQLNILSKINHNISAESLIGRQIDSDLDIHL